MFGSKSYNPGPMYSTGETDESRRRRMAKARADVAKARADERRERFAIRKDESGKRVLNKNYTNWAKPAAEARAKKAAAKAGMTKQAKAAHDAAMARKAPPAEAKTPAKTMTNAERFAIRKDESGNRVLNKHYVNSPAGKRAAAAAEAKKAAAEAEAKKASAAKTADRRKAVSEYKARGSSMPTPSRRRSSFGGGSSQPPRPAPQRSAPQRSSAEAEAKTADRRKAVSEYKARGSSMPTRSRRSSFGGGASRPPAPAPQRSSAAPQTASRGPMAPMDAARRSQQQPRPANTPLPSGRAAGMMRGAMDMNRSSARGTGTPAPNMPAPPGINMNRREAYQPRRGAPMPGGRGMKEGGEVKKLSRGGGIAKRGTGKTRV